MDKPMADLCLTMLPVGSFRASCGLTDASWRPVRPHARRAIAGRGNLRGEYRRGLRRLRRDPHLELNRRSHDALACDGKRVPRRSGGHPEHDVSDNAGNRRRASVRGTRYHQAGRDRGSHESVIRNREKGHEKGRRGKKDDSLLNYLS